VQIGAILTLAARTEDDIDSVESSISANRRRKRFTAIPDAKLDVLGQSLLDRTFAKLEAAGIEAASVIPEGSTLNQLLPAKPILQNDFTSAWEKSVARIINQGVDTLLLLRTSTYSDLDYEELFSFHAQRRAALTRVYSSDQSVDVAVVDANFLRNSGDGYRKALSALIPQQEHFFYHGYVNRLRKSTDFRRLVEDALNGKCNLRPAGSQVAEGIWFGPGAEVDDSAQITGPAFIGANTRIAACANISGATAIERDCEIDCSTSVDESWILQETYVGLGLNVRRSIVSNQKMFHLDRKTELPISDPRLIRATKSFSLFGAGSMLLNRLSTGTQSY
jgi:hypothetical protein